MLSLFAFSGRITAAVVLSYSEMETPEGVSCNQLTLTNLPKVSHRCGSEMKTFKTNLIP